VDWIRIDAWSGASITVDTLRLATGNDTVLYLYNPLSAQLAMDDDGGRAVGNGSLASRLTYRTSAAGVYYVKVVRYGSAGAAGRYDIKLTMN
jgi:hypothetical protein